MATGVRLRVAPLSSFSPSLRWLPDEEGCCLVETRWLPAGLGCHPTHPVEKAHSSSNIQSNGISLALPGGHVSCLNQSQWTETVLCSNWPGLGQMVILVAKVKVLPQFSSERSRCTCKNGVRRGIMADKQAQRIQRLCTDYFHICRIVITMK